MKLRDLRRKIRRGNELGRYQRGTIDAFVSTTSTIATAVVTYGTVTTASTTNFRATSKLIIPSTAWTGANAETAIYVTAGYLFAADDGTWASAAIG